MAVKKISAGIALEGEKEFRTAITGINKELGVLKSEMAATKEAFDGQANTLTALTTKHTSLSKILETQKQKVVEVNAGLENAKSNYEKVGNKVDELKKAHEDAVKAMKAMEDSSDSTTEEIKEQEQEVARLVKELEKSEDTYEKASNKVKDWEKSLNIANKEVTQTDNALKKNAEYMREASTSADKCATSIDEFGKKSKNASESVGQTEQAIQALGQALVTAGVAKGLKEAVEALKECANASIEFESAITGVYKTVDGTDAQLQAISDGIKEISTVIPAGTTELAAVAEAAGQLGIKTDDVLKFTEVMTNLGVTTNLTAEDAAVKIAKFANIVGTSADNYERLGSVIVAMGNNFATTEADITNMATNLASAGKLAGMSEANIVALSTAMSSVGIQAEAGGTAMTQTFTAMEKAVAGGTKELDEFARISGMSSEQFTQVWEGDAITAVQAFIGGLGELGEKGESATLVLDEMGLSGIRQANMLKSLGLASDVLTESITTADVAWKENTALTEEAALRYGTLESKQQLLRNSVNLLKIAIGDELTPSFSKAVEAGTNLTDWATSMVRENPWLVAAITGLTTSLGLLAGGLAALMIAKKVIEVMKVLNITMLSNPFVLVAAAIAGVVVALGTLAASGRIATTESANMASEARNLAKEAKELRNSIAEQEQAFNDNANSTQAQYIAYQNMTERLYELDSALRNEIHTTGEANAIKGEMASLVKELNAVMPELNLEIDEQNGLIKQGKKITDNYIITMQEKAKQAVIEEQLTELYRKQAEAQVQLAEAGVQKEAAQDAINTSTEKAIAITNAYNEMLAVQMSATYDSAESYAQYEKTIDNIAKKYSVTREEMENGANALERNVYSMADYESALADATKAQEEATATIEETNVELEIKREVLEGVIGKENEATKSTAELGEQSGLTAAEIKEATESIQKRYEEMHKSIRDSVDNSITAFDEFSGGQKITAAEMQKNLDSQIAGLTEWKDNMLTISKETGRGMTSELMDELINLGPKGANAVKTLVEALEKNDGSFEKLAKTWADALNLKDPIASELEGVARAIDTEVSKIENSLAVDTSKLPSSFDGVVDTVITNLAKIPATVRETNEQAISDAQNAGARIPQELAQGIVSGGAAVKTSATKINELLKIPRAGEDGKKAGAVYTQGVVSGIDSNAKSVDSSAVAAVKAAVGAVASIEIEYSNRGKNLMVATAQGMSDNAESVARAARTAAQAGVSAISGYYGTFVALGNDAGQGFANGISAKVSAAAAAATSMVRAAMAAVATTQKSASPAKEFTKLGVYGGQGYAQGFKRSTPIVSAAVNELVKTSIDTMKSTISSTVGEAIHKGLNNSGETIVRGPEEYARAFMTEAKRNLNDMQSMANISLKQQETYWKEVVDNLHYMTYYQSKESLPGYKQAQMELQKVQEDILRQRLKDMENNLAHQQALDKVTLTDEISFWQKYLAVAKKGSDEYLKAQENLYKVQKSQKERLRDLEENYKVKVVHVNNELKNSVADLTLAYHDSVKSRQDAIMKSTNLFDEFNSKTENSGEKLLYNLATQVEGLQNWATILEQLEKRGLTGSLLEELQEMGPAAKADLEALNTLTAEQLNDYVKLWEEKNRLAKQQATKENAGLLSETNAEIRKLTAEANASIKEAAIEYETSARELGISLQANVVTLTSAAVTAANTTLSTGGAAIVGGLVDELSKAFDEIAKQAEGKAKALAGIISSSEFSAYGAGVINAVNHAIPVTNTTNTTNQMVNVGGITIHVQSMDMDNIEEITQAINEQLGEALG